MLRVCLNMCRVRVSVFVISHARECRIEHRFYESEWGRDLQQGDGRSHSTGSIFDTLSARDLAQFPEEGYESTIQREVQCPTTVDAVKLMKRRAVEVGAEARGSFLDAKFHCVPFGGTQPPKTMPFRGVRASFVYFTVPRCERASGSAK